LRLLNVKSPDPAIRAKEVARTSHAALAPVVASFTAGVVDAGVVDAGVVDAGVDGVTGLELADDAEVPPALVAVEENV
jgi:hypothetical protein